MAESRYLFAHVLRLHLCPHFPTLTVPETPLTY